MHRTREGNRWFFGMKAHIWTDTPAGYRAGFGCWRQGRPRRWQSGPRREPGGAGLRDPSGTRGTWGTWGDSVRTEVLGTITGCDLTGRATAWSTMSGATRTRTGNRPNAWGRRQDLRAPRRVGTRSATRNVSGGRHSEAAVRWPCELHVKLNRPRPCGQRRRTGCVGVRH